MEVLVLLDGSDPSMSATVSVWQGSGVTNDDVLCLANV